MSIVVEKLNKRYAEGDVPAVFDADLVATRGGITTLLGPSGSGKTTLLRIIAGLEQADRGRILIHDVDVTRQPARARGLGFVFQGYALFSHLTVRDNIAFGLKLKRHTRKEVSTRVDELLELVQLSHLAARRPAELSGGQQQRVALARALAPRPKVLLLDEPFGALDAKVRVELRRWLRTLHAQTHVTTLLVTHDQEEALDLSDQVVLMNEGRIVQTGTPFQLYNEPASPFVASFIGPTTRLTGVMHEGHAQLGGRRFAPPEGATEGQPLVAYVRPGEIALSRGAGANAVVRLTRRVASHLEVDLVFDDGQRLLVQLSRAEGDLLVPGTGDRIDVDLGRPRFFLL